MGFVGTSTCVDLEGMLKMVEESDQLSRDLNAATPPRRSSSDLEVDSSISEYLTDTLFAQTPRSVKKISKSFKFSSEADAVPESAPDVIKLLRRFANSPQRDENEIGYVVVEEDPEKEELCNQQDVHAIVHEGMPNIELHFGLSPAEAETVSSTTTKRDDRNRTRELRGLQKTHKKTSEPKTESEVCD